jgi:hypothetical protein
MHTAIRLPFWHLIQTSHGSASTRTLFQTALYHQYMIQQGQNFQDKIPHQHKYIQKCDDLQTMSTNWNKSTYLFKPQPQGPPNFKYQSPDRHISH